MILMGRRLPWDNDSLLWDVGSIGTSTPVGRLSDRDGAGSGSMRLTASNLIQYRQNNDLRYITPAAPTDAPPEELWCVRPGMKIQLNRDGTNEETVEAFDRVLPAREEESRFGYKGCSLRSNKSEKLAEGWLRGWILANLS